MEQYQYEEQYDAPWDVCPKNYGPLIMLFLLSGLLMVSSILWSSSIVLHDDGAMYDSQLKHEQACEKYVANFADKRVLNGSELIYYLTYDTGIPVEMWINDKLVIATDTDQINMLRYYIAVYYAEQDLTVTVCRNEYNKIERLYIEAVS